MSYGITPCYLPPGRGDISTLDLFVDCYTVSPKKQYTKLLPVTSSNINRFSKFFTVRRSRRFVTKSYLNTPPHPKRVATLLCEIAILKE